MRQFVLHFATAAALTAACILPAHAHSTADAHATDCGGDAAAHEEHGAPVSEVAVSGDLSIEGGWARAMLPGQPAGGGYLSIANGGSEPDRLLGGSTPSAGRVEIHTMEVVDDVMTMRPVEGGLEIPAGGTVELKPGGLHLMFMEVGEPFSEGGSVPLTLEFDRAGAVEIVLPVRAARGGGHGH